MVEEINWQIRVCQLFVNYTVFAKFQEIPDEKNGRGHRRHE
jgi:hypothetical protein